MSDSAQEDERRARLHLQGERWGNGSLGIRPGSMGLALAGLVRALPPNAPPLAAGGHGLYPNRSVGDRPRSLSSDDEQYSAGYQDDFHNNGKGTHRHAPQYQTAYVGTHKSDEPNRHSDNQGLQGQKTVRSVDR